MDQKLEVNGSTAVCGMVGNDPLCTCIRPKDHWGPHVVLTPRGTYHLVQTVCMPITFEIAEAVALVAMNDKDWKWAD